jgi:hypothetical protein
MGGQARGPAALPLGQSIRCPGHLGIPRRSDGGLRPFHTIHMRQDQAVGAGIQGLFDDPRILFPRVRRNAHQRDQVGLQIPFVRDAFAIDHILERMA